jgi:hypothetical protein
VGHVTAAHHKGVLVRREEVAQQLAQTTFGDIGHRSGPSQAFVRVLSADQSGGGSRWGSVYVL